MIKYTISRDSLTFWDSYNNSYTVTSSHPWFDTIRSKLIDEDYENEQEIISYGSLEYAVQSSFDEVLATNYYSDSTLIVNSNGVIYNGEHIDNALTDRLISVFSESGDTEPWVKFLRNLYLNPSAVARSELYDWLKLCDLPITTDGYFLAFKKVTEDYKDYHTRTFDNSIGKTVQMADRSQVDAVRTNHCSRGLHFCSSSYLDHFYANGGKTIILKIHPADVVSIPDDYNFAKGRCWKYLVVGEIDSSIVATKKWPAVSNWTKPNTTLITSSER